MAKFEKKKYVYSLILLTIPLFLLVLPQKKSRDANTNGSNRAIQELVDGYKHYKDTVFPLHEKEFQTLVTKGQKPGVLMITCSDSRIVLSTLFTSDPGEIFVVRNVGNIVPSYVKNSKSNNSSVIAAIEYAVNVLGIKDVVVMGHSHCGAVEAIYDGLDFKGMQGLRNWLESDATVFEKAKQILKRHELTKDEALNTLEKFNVVAQIGHLKSYEFVKNHVDQGSLRMHGWYYDFDKAAISFYDPEIRGFKSLSSIDVK